MAITDQGWMPEGALTFNPGATTTTSPEGVSIPDSQISKDAQDVAKAQGVAYEDIAQQTEGADRKASDYAGYDQSGVSTKIGDTLDFQKTPSYIDTAKSTVAGQLSSLLASDSPYIQQAEQKAAEQAQSRGLLNSTLAAQAGREAAISQALPIAQQDAQTYAQGDLARQQAEYNLETIQGEAIVSGAMVQQQAAISQKNQDINNAFNARIQGATEQSKVWLNDLQNTYNAGLQNMQVAAQQMLLETELDSNRAQNVRDSAASIMQNYQISVENMMTDPDFLGLGTTAVNNALNQLQTVAVNSINFIGASAGVDMETFLDTYMEPIAVTV